MFSWWAGAAAPSAPFSVLVLKGMKRMSQFECADIETLAVCMCTCVGVACACGVCTEWKSVKCCFILFAVLVQGTFGILKM